MSQNPDQVDLADVLHDAVTVFGAPDTARLHGPAVRRGRQIKRRRAGATAAGGAVALGAAGVLAFTLSGAPSHGTPVSVANGGSKAATVASPSPAYTHPAVPPDIRPDAITASVIQDALEYALPPDAQVTQTGGFSANTNVEVVDPSSHSWYVQTAFTIKSAGQSGTSVAISVTHTAGSDSCSAILAAWQDKGQCTTSTLDGGKLLKTVLPVGVVSSDGVYETLEWFSPSGYGTTLELGDTTVNDIALTDTQADAVLANQVFTEIAQALPADACVGGSFSQPVDPPSVGQSPVEHVRCSTNGTLYPTSA